MHHLPRLLVHHEQLGVLVDDVHGELFGDPDDLLFQLRPYLDPLPPVHRIPGTAGPGVDVDLAFPDPALEAGTGELGQQLSQGLIEPPSRQGLWNL